MLTECFRYHAWWMDTHVITLVVKYIQNHGKFQISPISPTSKSLRKKCKFFGQRWLISIICIEKYQHSKKLAFICQITHLIGTYPTYTQG